MEYEIVLATGNPGKASEIIEILAARGGPSGKLKVITIKDAVGYAPDADEDSETLRGNAWKKVRAAERALREHNAGSGIAHIIVADDSGLFVDCLGGRPGVRSARYGAGYAPAGSNGATVVPPPEKQIEMLLAEIREKNARVSPRTDLIGPGRTASFKCYIAIVYPDGSTGCAGGEIKGEIALRPAGCGGFGYDPVFWLPQIGKTMAELSENEKNAISHRGIAIRRMACDIDLHIA